MNYRSSDITRERIKRILKIFVRLFSIPLVMGFGILAGIGIVELIDFFVTEYPKYGDLRSTFYTGSMAFGAAIILSIIKDLTQNMPNFYAYVFAKDNQQSREAFLKAFGAIFLASFALMLSILSLKNYTPSEVNLKLEFNQSIVPLPMDTKKSLLTMYVLYSEDAGYDAIDIDYADCEDPKDREGCEDHQYHSVCPHCLYDDQLKSLLKALISCGISEKNPTMVEVRGYASAVLPKDPDQLNEAQEKLKEAYDRVENEEDDKIKYGKAFNLYIAEKRAINLVEKIRELAGDDEELRKNLNKLNIYPYKWKKYQDMVCDLNLDDREDDRYIAPRGFLTRRAEIRVLKAPACE